MKKLFFVLLIVTFMVGLYARTKPSMPNEITTGEVSYNRDLNCPNGSIFSLSANGAAGGATSDIEPGYLCAQYFTGMTADIAQINWWGLNLFHDGSAWVACTENPMEFEISLWDDNAGVPGTILTTYSNNVVTGVPTGETYAGYEIIEYNSTLPAPYTLNSGWVSIQGNPANAACWFLWLGSGDAGTYGQQDNAGWGALNYPLALCLIGAATTTTDVGILGVTAPVTGELTATEAVTVTIGNFGATTQTSIPVSYTFDGSPVTETYTGSIPSLGTDTYTFSTTIDCSVPGPYSLLASTALSGDEDPTNDSYTHNFECFPTTDCDWKITGWDDYGDSWNGGFIDIYINNNLAHTWAGPASTGPDDFIFGIFEGSDIDIVWNAGGWPYEASYCVYNNSDIEVACDGVGGVDPVGLSDLAGTCVPPACPPPTDLVTTNVTSVSADLGWTAGATETLWDVQWGPAGFDPNAFPPGGTVVSALTATNHALSGLTDGVTYDWYARADCGGGLVSVWAGPETFLAFSALPNDDCVNAEVIGEVTDYPFDTTTATHSGVTACLGTTALDIWYIFTAPADGTLDVDLCGSTFDTYLGVFDDCVPTTTLGCNDDACGLQSGLYGMPVVGGEDYIIQVGGYSTAAGPGDITTIFTATPPAAPTGVDIAVNLNVRTDAVDVTWTVIAGLTYNVYSSDDPEAVFPGGWTLVETGNTTGIYSEVTVGKMFFVVTANN